MSIISKFNAIKSMRGHFKVSYFTIFSKYVSNRDEHIKVTMAGTEQWLLLAEYL